MDGMQLPDSARPEFSFWMVMVSTRQLMLHDSSVTKSPPVLTW
jgi:hypothetical protein